MNTAAHTGFALRRITICALTALAIAAPSAGSAGPFDRARSGIQTIKSKNNIVVTNIQSASQGVRERIEALPVLAVAGGLPVLEEINELGVTERFRDAMELLREMRKDYDTFTAGQRCGGECANTKQALRKTINELLATTRTFPRLDASGQFANRFEYLGGLVDKLPPSVLYASWQALGRSMDKIHMAPQHVRGLLDAIPPLDDSGPDVGLRSQSGSSTAADWAGEKVLQWCEFKAEEKPAVELLRARAKSYAEGFKFIADIIPDASVKGEAGGSAGAHAAAGAGVKPTDTPKIIFKTIAFLIETVDREIEISRLRARAVCGWTGNGHVEFSNL